LGTGSGQAEANVALIREISILVNELTSSLRSQGSELDVEPGALEQMHSRRALVQSLVKRFGDASKDDPESALIEDAKRNKALFLQLSDGDQGIAQLEREREEFAANLISASEMLTKTRRSRATELEREISEELTQLAMPAARITVAIDGVGDGLAVSDEKRTLICSNTGSDSVTFLLTPHAGATPLPINKGASGGELSRIMLAIEVVLAGRSSVPTYVFDEVDAGVGGKAAVEVGRRLALLARHAQVLVVTHLPQVAVWADTHYSIRKNSSETVTTSDLALLSEGERINELARMMAGREESALAQEHAQELLDFVAAERKRMGIARGKRA
jgi:DNA repair protein RecN (Recombination protein N)